MTNIDSIAFNGDHNLGLHAEPTDNFCLINSRLSDKCKNKVSEVLAVDHIELNVAGSGLIGIFCSANKNGVILPKNTEEDEKEILEKQGINYKILDTKYTALGNLILVNDNFCLISEKIANHKKEIADFFQVPVEINKIAGLDIVGSCGVVNKNGLLAHRETTEEEIVFLEDFFQTSVGIGTANFGSPYVGALIVANSSGLLTSHKTTGYELGRIQEALFPE